MSHIKKLFILVSIFIFIFGTQVFAKPVFVQEDVSTYENGVNISGSLTYVSSGIDSNFKKSINSEIDAIFNNEVQKAIDNNVKTLKVSSYHKSYNDIYSIVMVFETSTPTPMTDVYSVNFDASNNTFVDIDDIMGVNGIDLANREYAESSANNPNKYPPNEKISTDTAFYVQDGYIYFVLYNGNMFKMNLDSIISKTITPDDYFIKQGYDIKMVPLRTVCEGLGYKVVSDSENDVVHIYKGETLVATVSQVTNEYYIGDSYYSSDAYVTLGSDPITVNGTLYVPLSFFSEVMNVCYTVQQNGNIVFSDY